MHKLDNLRKELHALADPEKAKNLSRFFKTAKGEYGEGDIFLGITVPDQRIVVKKYQDLPLQEIGTLLQSTIHEERLVALLILVRQYKKGDSVTKKVIYEFYLGHSGSINNWDLVDSSAAYIAGPYLEDKSIDVLKNFAHSQNLWERRIAMLSTFYFIKQERHQEAFTIAEILMNDSHDLIHKAVGWMLREVGKHCGEEIEEEFLQRHYQTMPRTMLRYAIEHFPREKKRFYMTKITKQ